MLRSRELVKSLLPNCLDRHDFLVALLLVRVNLVSFDDFRKKLHFLSTHKKHDQSILSMNYPRNSTKLVPYALKFMEQVCLLKLIKSIFDPTLSQNRHEYKVYAH